MKRLSVLIAIISVLSVVSGDARNIKSQKFKLTSTFTIKGISQDAKEIKFWMPYPFENSIQSINKRDFKVPGTYHIITENKFNNKILYGTIKNIKKGSASLHVTYEIERKELVSNPVDIEGSEDDTYPQEVLKFLKGSRLAKITPRIKELAKEITSGQKTKLNKAKAIYRYVLKYMDYNKSEPGWGMGDSERACLIGKGNCTDFHSLFNSLARASNIPAKFVIGFPIPHKKQAEIKGYHCWAEFYVNKVGWIPVDISEAWKNKSKQDYYFGNLDQYRVGFTVGRDIILNSDKGGSPVNYFIYPYVEIDGRATANVETTYKSELL